MGSVIPLKLGTDGVFGQFASGDTIPSSFLPVDTDGTLAADSDTVIATQKASKAYMDSLIALARFGGHRIPSVAVNDYAMTAQIGDAVSCTWGGSTAASVNICRFTQFALGYTIKTDRLRMEVTSAATTGSLRLGIFADAAGAPGVVQCQGTVAWAVAQCEATFTEVTLPPGVYWAAACAQHTSGSSTNPQYRGGQRGPVHNGWSSPGTGSSYYPLKYATISGAFTDNPSLNEMAATATLAPPIWMKVTARP